MKPKFLCTLAVAAILILAPLQVFAIPSLQLYIDGATYDTVTETWVYPGYEYDLWAIGSMDPDETIVDAKIAAAVRPGQSGNISIMPILANGSYGTALSGDFYSLGTPVKGDDKPLPDHGIYPSDFFEFLIGNFSPVTKGLADFTLGYDPENPVPTKAWGEIKKFHVVVTGFDWVHFDLYNHVEGDNHALFAPFSHDADAEDGPSPVPEPATMMLFGTGLVGLAAAGKKRFSRGR